VADPAHDIAPGAFPMRWGLPNLEVEDVVCIFEKENVALIHPPSAPKWKASYGFSKSQQFLSLTKLIHKNMKNYDIKFISTKSP
jgi:hypothetical protein